MFDVHLYGVKANILVHCKSGALLSVGGFGKCSQAFQSMTGYNFHIPALKQHHDASAGVHLGHNILMLHLHTSHIIVCHLLHPGGPSEGADPQRLETARRHKRRQAYVPSHQGNYL